MESGDQSEEEFQEEEGKWEEEGAFMALGQLSYPTPARG